MGMGLLLSGGVVVLVAIFATWYLRTYDEKLADIREETEGWRYLLSGEWCLREGLSNEGPGFLNDFDAHLWEVIRSFDEARLFTESRYWDLRDVVQEAERILISYLDIPKNKRYPHAHLEAKLLILRTDLNRMLEELGKEPFMPLKHETSTA